MGIFNRSRTFMADFSAIGTDIHNHVIPGIDDGSPSLQESLRMLRLWEELGFRKVVTTPHVITSAYPNTRETILGQMFSLQEKIEEEGINIILEASGEYHIDYEFLERLENNELIPIGRRRLLLLELPFQKPAFPVEEILKKVRGAGYEPVIVHPERYVYLMGRIKQYEALKNSGVWFQLNLLSLIGQYGLPAKMAARQLIDAGMIDLAGSDAHHSGHLESLRKVLEDRYFDKLMRTKILLNSEL